MKRLTLLVPLLALTAFGNYYRAWDDGQRERLAREAREPLAVFARRDGAADACADLAAGRRRWFALGEPASSQGEYAGLLARIYRIELADAPGRGANAAVARYVADYNAVMSSEIHAVFGEAPFAPTADLARSAHQLSERVARYVPPL